MNSSVDCFRPGPHRNTQVTSLAGRTKSELTAIVQQGQRLAAARSSQALAFVYGQRRLDPLRGLEYRLCFCPSSVGVAAGADCQTVELVRGLPVQATDVGGHHDHEPKAEQDSHDPAHAAPASVGSVGSPGARQARTSTASTSNASINLVVPLAGLFVGSPLSVQFNKLCVCSTSKCIPFQR